MKTRPLHEALDDWTYEGRLKLYDPRPRECVELCIYDNDGPEGLFNRLRFSRSYQAVKFLLSLDTGTFNGELNFTIENFWTKTP